MDIRKQGGWVYYIGKREQLDRDKGGKWMYFFSDKDFVAKLCQNAVQKGIVVQCKHSDANNGVACFYMNSDDFTAHKRTISYFLENDLIPKTVKGKLYNISFKLNSQTREGRYGEEFKPHIRLDQFVNLYTGEWVI